MEKEKRMNLDEWIYWFDENDPAHAAMGFRIIKQWRHALEKILEASNRRQGVSPEGMIAYTALGDAENILNGTERKVSTEPAKKLDELGDSF